MFWVVDNFLMKKGRTKAKLEAEDDPRGNSKVRYRRAMSHDDSESEVSWYQYLDTLLNQFEVIEMRKKLLPAVNWIKL